jgi:hypothetical protein
MHKRKLGALEVSELGFGTLSFASTYGQAPEKAGSIRVIRGAHDLGVTLFESPHPERHRLRLPAHTEAFLQRDVVLDQLGLAGDAVLLR